MKHYNVHIYSVWRTPVRVKATSQQAAIKKAIAQIGLDEASVLPKGSEFAGEVMNYMVDELDRDTVIVLSSTEFDWKANRVERAITVGALMGELEAARTVLINVLERLDVKYPKALYESISATLTRIGPLLGFSPTRGRAGCSSCPARAGHRSH